MYFTRTDDTFRAWFQVVRSAGTLRTGALSSSFAAVIINPFDTAQVSASVTQSLQKEGLYRFDIPASFISASGPGEYGISVEVNIPAPAAVTTAFSNVLRVSYQDFDTIVSASVSASMTLASASVNQIVSGVWNVSTASFQNAGTMGYYQVFPIVTVSASISASVDVPSIVSGVWNAQTASFTTPGTMGFALGTISGSLFSISSSLLSIINSVTNISNSISGLTSGSIADAVWDEVLSGHSLSGSTGIALQQLQTRIHEIYQILGLELTNPMTVTQTLRAVAAISQSLAGSPSTSVTVTRL